MGKEGPSVMGFLDLDSIGPARQACRLFRDVPLERYVAQVIYAKHAMHTYMRARARVRVRMWVCCMYIGDQPLTPAAIRHTCIHKLGCIHAGRQAGRPGYSRPNRRLAPGNMSPEHATQPERCNSLFSLFERVSDNHTRQGITIWAITI